MSAATKEPKSWTKSEEIAFLDKIVVQLGERSYLGPWLKENRNQIAADISNDVVIELETPYKAYRRGLDIIADARKEAEEILTAARLKAADEYAKTREDIAQSRAYARRQLEQIAGRL